MSRWRGLAIPFLLIALPLGVEVGGRWVELALSLALVGAAVAAFRRFPLLVVSLSVAGAVVPALVLSPIATSPVRGWPFAAAAVFGYLAGRWSRKARPVGAALAGVLLAGLPVGVAVDVFERGSFGALFGLYDWRGRRTAPSTTPSRTRGPVRGRCPDAGRCSCTRRAATSPGSSARRSSRTS